MSKVKVELNRAGVRDLMRGREMTNVLIRYADRISEAAGEGYSTYVGSNRANVSVRTVTKEAYQDNLENNTLEKVIRQ